MKHLFLYLLFSFSVLAASAQISVNSGFSVAAQQSAEGKQYKLVNNKHVPYESVAEYMQLIPKTRRHIGQIAYIADSTGKITIYQFAGGIEAENFNPVLLGPVTFPGGPVTSIPEIGFNPGTNITAEEFITTSFYQSQRPTATLTGGLNLEYRSAGNLTYTLNWTAGRLAATKPITQIEVAGVNQTFITPVEGATVSGTQSVTFPANQNITYNNRVTTSDNKTASATTTFNFLPRRYFGWISDTTGIGVFGFDDSKITTLSNELIASKAKGQDGNWNTGAPTGNQFYVYAYYSTAGDLTQWDMNGFPSLSAMNKVTRSFTNALGYTGTWTIYWSKNGQTQSSTIVAN